MRSFQHTVEYEMRGIHLTCSCGWTSVADTLEVANERVAAHRAHPPEAGQLEGDSQ